MLIPTFFVLCVVALWLQCLRKDKCEKVLLLGQEYEEAEKKRAFLFTGNVRFNDCRIVVSESNEKELHLLMHENDIYSLF